MGVIIDLDSKGSELGEQAFDFLLPRISPHVAQLFIFITGQNLVHDPCKFIGDCDFGFIF